jgi:prepilin-type N-terminal cleavage/methylation domain-containing protein
MQLTRSARDDGYTLVELLVSMVILGIVIVPLTGVIIGYLRNVDATNNRLALSHDAQISAAYFAADVASVGIHTATPQPDGTLPFLASIQLNAPYNKGGKTCGTAATPDAQVRFLSDDWDTSGAAPAVGTDVVAYYVTTPVGGVGELHRMRCNGSAAPVSDIVLAHHVKFDTTHTPPTPIFSVACTSSCEAAAVPQRVTITFIVTLPSVGDYPVTLTGQRRQT